MTTQGGFADAALIDGRCWLRNPPQLAW